MKKIYELTVVKKLTYKAFLIADSYTDALDMKNVHSTTILREHSPSGTFINSAISEYNGPIVATDVFKLMNSNEETLFLSAEEHKEKYPFLCSMYDPCDPGHTRGVSDYFIDQLTDMITLENKAEVMKEIRLVFQYGEIIIQD